MKTNYWDYSDAERAALTEDEVRKLLDFELMEKGVLKVEAPKLDAIEQVALATRQVFGVQHKDARYYNHRDSLDIVFDDAEAAGKFLALNPRLIKHDHETDTWVAHFILDATIEPKSVADEESAMAARSVLLSNKEKAKRNAAAKDDFEKASAAVHRATEGLWDDWHRCRRLVERHKKIIATFEEYGRLTGGNADLACTFLGKAFPKVEIAEAFAWGKIEAPSALAGLAQPESKAKRDDSGRDTPF